MSSNELDLAFLRKFLQLVERNRISALEEERFLFEDIDSKISINWSDYSNLGKDYEFLVRQVRSLNFDYDIDVQLDMDGDDKNGFNEYVLFSFRDSEKYRQLLNFLDINITTDYSIKPTYIFSNGLIFDSHLSQLKFEGEHIHLGSETQPHIFLTELLKAYPKVATLDEIYKALNSNLERSQVIGEARRSLMDAFQKLKMSKSVLQGFIVNHRGSGYQIGVDLKIG